MCTIAFDAVLYYIQQTETTTAKATLQEFQAFLVQHIDEFITHEIQCKKKK
jgi:hypothetical protein